MLFEKVASSKVLIVCQKLLVSSFNMHNLEGHKIYFENIGLLQIIRTN